MELNAFQLISFELIITGVGIYLGLKSLPLNKDNMNYFRRSVVVLDLSLLVNIPIRLLELHLVHLNRTLIYWLYDASIFFMSYLLFNWFLFLLKQINSPLVKTTLRVHICMLPALFTVLFCVINRWTGWLYFVGDDGWYHRGSIFILQSLVAYLYFALIVIVNIIHFFRFQERQIVKKCFISIIPAFISGFLQFAFGGSFLLAGSVVCALIMYVEICLDRQKAYEFNEQLSAINSQLASSNKTIANNMRTILALSDIYHIIYDIDVQNDTFSEIKAPEFISKFCRQFSKASQCLKAIPEAMYDGDNLKAMKELYNPATLASRFKDKKSYSSDAIGKYSKRWLRNSFVVSEIDEQGNPLHIIITLQDVNLEKEHQKKLEEAAFYEKSARELEELFTQTAEALASAIDAKDVYTHGHSVRVAEYSRKIAEMAKLSEQDCKEVYYAGLLHDVGKIGIPDYIIHKTSKLTMDEFAQIKKHPTMGKEILQSISKLPYLSVGAHYHHERYDGHGYPDGLKATDIPEFARIIAVADAYDAMTSKRSYRDPIPQQKVREEIVKGLGTQFDPKYGKLMLHLIDLDTDYEMKERQTNSELSGNGDLICRESRKNYTEGIVIDSHKVVIKAHCTKKSDASYPFIILFDSLDARIHEEEKDKKDLLYAEYCELYFDGKSNCTSVRKISIDKKNVADESTDLRDFDFVIEAAKVKDHIVLKMSDGKTELDTTIALSDNTRYAYISVTGKDCTINNISIKREETLFPVEKIHRIAEEISYLDEDNGDIPGVQIDGWRTAHSKGIAIENDVNVNFHMKSLPFARLVWHCPYAVIYTSENGEVYGPGYRELLLVRFDGEGWNGDTSVMSRIYVTQTEEFKSWDSWKKGNIAGRDIELKILRDDDVITLTTDCGGIAIKDTLTLLQDIKNLYVSITGDQTVVENIKIS